MKYLVTGGCGFLGSNIAAEILKRGFDLLVIDNLSRIGSDKNLKWLKTIRNDFNFYNINTWDYDSLSTIIKNEKPDVIYHLAGQVAMTTSISNPRLDFNTNVLGTFNILESVKQFDNDAVVVYSSTNKVYGDFEYFNYEETDTRYICKEYPYGFPETVNLDFHSPYGCSKGSADQYMLDYARIFGLNTVVFRHSSMFGPHQYGTYDQGWISWFVMKALEIKNNKIDRFTISGNGKQVRDVLFADDMVNLYLSVPEHINAARGNVFNVGGGYENSLSLLELFDFLNKELNIVMKYDVLPPRQSDQKVFIADISKVNSVFQWQPNVDKYNGIREMIKWLKI